MDTAPVTHRKGRMRQAVRAAGARAGAAGPRDAPEGL